MKKILFFLLAAILPVMASAYDACIDGIYYNFDKTDNTAEVIGGGDNYYFSGTDEGGSYKIYVNSYSGVVNIPLSVDYDGITYDVTRIGDDAFTKCNCLTSITIPNSITSIGSYAFFHCSGLTSLTIPNSVKSLGNGTFQGCSSLISITIPNGVTSIEDHTFFGCSGLTSFTIPNSVTSIGSSAFSGCSGLTSVTIPNSVTSIGKDAFSGCDGFSLVKVPVTDYSAFCENKTVGCIYSSISKPVQLINKEGAEIKEYVVPDGVTSIGNSTFMNCTGLTAVTVPNSVTSIGNYVFYKCSGLTSITIGDGVTSMGSYVFTGCNSISTVKVSVTDYSALCENKIVGLLNSNIGKPIQLIDKEGAEIKEFVAPEGVTSIGNSAFRNCSGLTAVTIPGSVTSIGDFAFEGCSDLTAVTIGNGVTNIGERAFDSCSSLSSVTIGSGVTSIGLYAFGDCPSIMTVRSYIKEPFNITKFANDTYRQGTLYVPNGTKDIYIRFDGWREFLNIVEMGEEPAPNGQCAKPSIIIAGKSMRYECETPGAEFESILTTEEQRFGGDRLVMENKDLVYILTVYATAPGYDRSEPAQVKFIVSRNDVNQDGIIDVADIATIISAMARESREERKQ